MDAEYLLEQYCEFSINFDNGTGIEFDFEKSSRVDFIIFASFGTSNESQSTFLLTDSDLENATLPSVTDFSIA